MSGNKKPKCIPLFSDEDNDLLSDRWRLDNTGYARAYRRKTERRYRVVYAHRLVCERKYGDSTSWKSGYVCDHINHNTMDNRRENLRIVPAAINCINRKNFGEKVGRVAWNADCMKWQAYWKNNYIGVFDTQEIAHNRIAIYVHEYIYELEQEIKTLKNR